MALPICIEIPEITALDLTLPGGAAMQAPNLMEIVQPALTPLMPLFDIIDAVVAVFQCIKAVPDALGPPPDPTVLAQCLPDLAAKVAKLLRLVPALSLPYTIVGIIDLVVNTLRQARAQLVHLQVQLQRMVAAIDRASELNDSGLAAIIACADANVRQEAGNVGRALGALGKLIGILNIFLGMVGLAEVPDLSSLAGAPLEIVIAPLDALITVMQTARGSIPLP